MNYQITQWCAHFISEHVKEGDLCIDATMGNGNDTLLLSRLCGGKRTCTRFRHSGNGTCQYQRAA